MVKVALFRLFKRGQEEYYVMAIPAHAMDTFKSLIDTGMEYTKENGTKRQFEDMQDIKLAISLAKKVSP